MGAGPLSHSCPLGPSSGSFTHLVLNPCCLQERSSFYLQIPGPCPNPAPRMSSTFMNNTTQPSKSETWESSLPLSHLGTTKFCKFSLLKLPFSVQET